MSKHIAIVKPGTLKSKDKEKLSKNGFIVIETSETYNVQIKEISEESKNESFKLVFDPCVSCGERIYMPQERLDALKKSRQSFYCTRGHSQSFK